MGCVCPGFNDTPVWGWGNGPRVAPHENGIRYNKMWELSIEYDLDIVQILTRNDWNEGSQIEPGDTYGFDYLISTKKYSAMFKQKQDNIPDSLLQKALQLYNMRKDGSATKEQADTILNDILKYLDNNIA